MAKDNSYNFNPASRGAVKAYEIIPIDVMREDMFIVTIRYRHCPAFKFDIEDICTKILERKPTLQNKNF